MQYDPTGLQSFTQWAMGKTIVGKTCRKKKNFEFVGTGTENQAWAEKPTASCNIEWVTRYF